MRVGNGRSLRGAARRSRDGRNPNREKLAHEGPRPYGLQHALPSCEWKLRKVTVPLSPRALQVPPEPLNPFITRIHLQAGTGNVPADTEILRESKSHRIVRTAQKLEKSHRSQGSFSRIGTKTTVGKYSPVPARGRGRNIRIFPNASVSIKKT